MTISISDKLAKLSDTKLFITLGIIVVLFLSYLFICLDGLVYNKTHGKSILGRKYRLLSFSLCTVLSVIWLTFRSFSIVAAAAGSLIGICIVKYAILAFSLFTDDPEAEHYIYTEYWAKGCPSDQPRYNIYIGGKPVFEKRKSDGKVVLRKRRTDR